MRRQVFGEGDKPKMTTPRSDGQTHKDAESINMGKPLVAQFIGLIQKRMSSCEDFLLIHTET